MMNASAGCSPRVALYHVRRGKAARKRRPAEVPRSPLVAPNDVDICGLAFPILSRNLHGLRGAIRHIRSCRGCDIRRETMHRIPGDIIRVGVVDIAGGRWRRDVRARFAIGWAVSPILHARPESICTVSAVMPERSGDGWARSRMCSRALRGSCACECLARSKD
jgi:hypothetical protein